MNLLLVESVTAGAFDRPLEHGLVEEAGLMLAAMVADAVVHSAGPSPRVDARLLRRADLPSLWPGLEQTVPMEGWARVWADALAWADALWLVAPETGGELEALTRDAEAAGVRVLGASADAVSVAGSKSACHAALAGRVRQPADMVPGRGWVIKPDDGVAADGVRRIVAGASPQDVPAPPPGCLVQPFVDGEPLSLCVLSSGRAARVLSVNRQRVEWDTTGRAQYRGGVTNAIADRARFLPLAQAVQDAVPGLRGCWGIDLVLTADGEPVLIEVNPRLTTAFAHLRTATGFDILAALLEMAAGQPLPDALAGRPVSFGLQTAARAAP